MKHAFLIYVLMTEGDVNLPRIMRDILLVRPTKHPNHLLPFPVGHICTLRGLERRKGQSAGKTPQVASATGTAGRTTATTRARAGPSTFATPSAPAEYSFKPALHDIMRRFDRQDRQIARTQDMIRRAFPHANFTGLGFSSSSDDGESQEF
ncbi:hypothetical protein PIB30_034186 [Stylosanthes scabra]|uniref:Uncharacterized protein n=1 Tax=Stylosanthes scabra TaxID=79078 RepID=A0ABU6QCD0_9FABA|nr:hypothetical protein [Stylosanthes scabra]